MQKRKTNSDNQIHEKSEIIYDRSESSSSKKRKEVIINGIRVTRGENSNIIIKNGIIVRKASVWGVVGHWRHYKNGKKIYIEPYKKGPDRLIKDPEPKTFKVKDIESGN